MSWRERRRRRPTFWDLVMDLFEEFERIEEEFDEWFRRSVREIPGWEEIERGVRVYGPYYYGVSVSIGPDGRPVIREFGNIKPTRFGPRFVEEREPLVDVMEEDDEVVVIAELPGVEKEDIDLRCDGRELIISVDTERRKYYKQLELPSEVDPSSARASYKNGVLEVKLKKVRPERKGERIKVE
ncbi:MAG TPA: Hsp20/alpha crystallin family protein [Candidatus Bathyarchaeota archaeon]|nr:Hsp20/alpha crystallin family protein [Candidatus Bathyarchaeota archaeon]HEW89788.1 Hsp20/alpha crystallin family protein [Candidatus Bathyarchaeota archaeon]